MKKNLLLLFLFISFPFYSQIDDLNSDLNVSQPLTPLSFTETTNILNYTGCNYFGTITIYAMGGEGPYTYSQDGINYVSNNVFSVLPGLYTIYTKDSTGSIAMKEVMLYGLRDMIQNPILSVTNVTCNGGNDGSVIFDPTKYSGTYIYEIDGGTPQTGNIVSGLSAGTYFIGVRNTAAGCGTMIQITIMEPSALTASVFVENQTITINTTGGYGKYKYSIDGEIFQSSNILNNASYGVHEILVRDESGCIIVNIVSVHPPAPLINGENQVAVEFKTGHTLADLVVEGQNIKWYSNSNNVAKKTNKSSEATLPLSTLLVNGTTYYASQTINGIESTKRLAVTAKLSSSLATPDFVLPDFTYFPNPVKHTLTINNTSNIDEVEIFSVSGKSVLTRKVNSDHSEIDLSNVSSGVYFLKVKAEGKTKTIKIVKK